MSKNTLNFNIEGEFINNVARSWYYEEKRPYEKCEELLLSCMGGTNLDQKTLKKLAKDVIIGRKKFVGSAVDGSFGMINDSEFDPTVYFENRKKNEKNKNWHYDLANEKNYLAPNQDVYGWLEPDGTFHEKDWDHFEAAREHIEKKGWKEEFKKHFRDNLGSGNGYPVDFLIFVKGWVLLHSPSRGTAIPEFDIKKRMTKAQREFLYDYYLAREDMRSIKMFLEN